MSSRQNEIGFYKARSRAPDLDKYIKQSKNGWLDADKRVYIYYSLEDVMEDLNCSKNTANM